MEQTATWSNLKNLFQWICWKYLHCIMVNDYFWPINANCTSKISLIAGLSESVKILPKCWKLFNSFICCDAGRISANSFRGNFLLKYGVCDIPCIARVATSGQTLFHSNRWGTLEPPLGNLFISLLFLNKQWSLQPKPRFWGNKFPYLFL